MVHPLLIQARPADARYERTDTFCLGRSYWNLTFAGKHPAMLLLRRTVWGNYDQFTTGRKSIHVVLVEMRNK